MPVTKPSCNYEPSLGFFGVETVFVDCIRPTSFLMGLVFFFFFFLYALGYSFIVLMKLWSLKKINNKITLANGP